MRKAIGGIGSIIGINDTEQEAIDALINSIYRHGRVEPTKNIPR